MMMIGEYLQWELLMTNWNKNIFLSTLRGKLSTDQIRSGWLGRSGATEKQIVELEERLRLKLPSSYRNFLLFTNGWEGVVTHSIYRILPTEEVNWFFQLHPTWLEVWLRNLPNDDLMDDIDYFEYDRPMEPFLIRISHLKECLCVSDIGDGSILLLNPKVINQDNEWEAWFFSNWAGGANRYRSFYEMMNAKFVIFMNIEREAKN